MAWSPQPRAPILRFYGLFMFWNDFRIIKPQNLGSLLMKSSQSNFNLRWPSSYLARSYLIATVLIFFYLFFSYQFKQTTQSFMLQLLNVIEFIQLIFPQSASVRKLKVSLQLNGLKVGFIYTFWYALPSASFQSLFVVVFTWKIM